MIFFTYISTHLFQFEVQVFPRRIFRKNTWRFPRFQWRLLFQPYEKPVTSTHVQCRGVGHLLDVGRSCCWSRCHLERTKQSYRWHFTISSTMKWIKHRKEKDWWKKNLLGVVPHKTAVIFVHEIKSVFVDVCSRTLKALLDVPGWRTDDLGPTCVAYFVDAALLSLHWRQPLLGILWCIFLYILYRSYYGFYIHMSSLQ